ncbi:MAG: serine/threonine-protein phosphatase [Acidobacteria bacterium]|nr:serine/threonine-protein phosphatase [Acidobacteriota bacterium]
MTKIQDWPQEALVEEILHFQDVAALILPREENLPALGNIDFFAAIVPYKGFVCGDHLIVLNFAEYNLQDKIARARETGNDLLAATLASNIDRFGILIADVAGHRISDSVTANYLHGAFKTGVSYELACHGQVTAGLFEMLNTIFYNRMAPGFLGIKPFVTLIYGEVLNDGRFRFLSAGHPPPIVFSQKYDRIVALGDECTRSSTPLGIIPSQYHVDIEHFDPVAITKDRYSVNEIHLLEQGDIMLLYTDGLTDHRNGDVMFCDTILEHVLREAKAGTAKDIFEAIRSEMCSFGAMSDDLTIAVFKKL